MHEGAQVSLVEKKPTEDWLRFVPAAPAGRAKGQRDMTKVGRQYGDALEELARADAKMRRAFHAYERARQTVNRLGKILDKAHAESDSK